MVFSHIVSSSRGNLTLQQTLQLANIYLENASSVQDLDIVLVLCHDAEVSLTQARKGARHSDPITREGIGHAYISLGRVLNSRGHVDEAKASYKKAEKWGGKIPDHESSAESSNPKSMAPLIKNTVDSVTVDTPPVQDQPVTSLKKVKKPNDTVTIPAHIFAENVRPSTVMAKLPEPDERLISTPQLACCLGLLKDSHELDDILEPAARNWLQVVENDVDEHERLKILSLDVIRTFKKEEIKDAKAVAEVVCLAPVIERDIFRDLLRTFYDGIDHSGLLDIHRLQGLAQLIQGADTGYLDSDDLVKILGLLTTRLKETHRQSPQHIYQLTLAASYVLDAMADTKVEGLDRETLHEPLSSYMDALKGNSEPYLVYQAAYACQALLCVPDNESIWQATIRRTGKVVRGVSGLVSAVKGLDLNGFMDGLKDIQQGIAGASEAVQVLVTAFDGVKSMTEGGQGFLEGIKEGLSFKRKCAWYSALRGADTLIRDGEFATFKQLVCEAPCRIDPAFQWGVCQRLGEVAGNSAWDARTRRSAAAFLGEIYMNGDDWALQTSVKEWIINILVQLSSSVGGAQQYIDTLLQELEMSSDAKHKERFRVCRDKDLRYPLKLALPPLASPSLLDRVQNKPDVEGTLRQLRKHRLKERGIAVYIQPQAKASLQASDDERFPLMEKVNEFLDSDQKVFLLLGDSGAGKSTFNKQLEYELWNSYKKATGRIPLFITLPAIDKPEQDLIAKQLRKSEFTESELRELKMHRKFILICDGYDESQQTHNLYMSNRLNQPGEWNAQMVISCRSEYIGVDYRDRFQPGDRNHRSDPGQLQEAVITPFTSDQVHDYVKQYVSVHQPLWETKEYEQALDFIPGLKDLVKNPFLMTLSLEVLPRMVDPGERLSATQVTRVALYDQFIEHWLERGKKRLSEKELSSQAKAAYESLVDEGFTQNGIDFLKKLAVAIYKEQEGQPIVKYSRFKDEGTWKAPFFSREDEKQLLREACPLTRSGNQHRFIHRSLLEYGLALAIFDPRDWKENQISAPVSSRRGSTSSAYSFRADVATKDVTAPADQDLDINSPLMWRYFTDEPSVLQFLSERAQQEPLFRKQLHGCIEHSKADKKWRIAAANAISVLVRAGVQFNHADLRGIRVPGADISYGVFESAQLQAADLRQVSLRGTWLQQADLSSAQMSGAQFGELPYHLEDRKILCCSYSPDGNSLVVSLGNGIIKLYSTSTWELTRTLAGHDGFAGTVTFSPKGDQIASGGLDSTLRLWNIESETCTHIMIGHEGDVNSVAYSPQGDTVASAGDEIVRLWDVATGVCRLTLTGHDGRVYRAVYSPNGRQIVSGGDGDCALRLWDVETGACLRTLSGHSDTIFAVAYSPQGDRVVSCGRDQTIRIWDIESGACHRVLTGHSNDVLAVVYSPQGDVIATASNDKTVRLWDAETGSCHQILKGHRDGVNDVVFSPRRDRITSASDDGRVRFWDVGSGVTREVSTGHYGGVMAVKYSPRDNQVISFGCDGSVRSWDVETGACSRILSCYSSDVRRVDYSPRGDLFASVCDDAIIRLWDVESGDCRRLLIGPYNYIMIIRFSPQGDQVASGDYEGLVKIWDVDTGECRYTFRGHTGQVMDIFYSPKGDQIATSSENIVRVWSLESGTCLRILNCDESVMSIAYSPQGHCLVTASDDKVLRVWDMESEDCRSIATEHADTIYMIVYSPQEDQVASGDYSGVVKIWDVVTGECRHILVGHTDRVTNVVYSSKGHILITSGDDMTIRLWDTFSGQCRVALPEFDNYTLNIAWSAVPGMDCFIAGSRDGVVRMWQVVEEEGACHVRLLWGSMNGALVVKGASIQDVRGLGQLNEQLLTQRGAVGEPYVRLRQAGKKLISMASVVSTLKKTSGKTAQDLAPPASRSEEKSRQLEEQAKEDSD